jgi:hypothetical protein
LPYVTASTATYTIEVQPAVSPNRLFLSTPGADVVTGGDANLYAVAAVPGTSYTVSLTVLTDSAAALSVSNGGPISTLAQPATPKDVTVVASDTVLYIAVDGFAVTGPTGGFVIMATSAPVVVSPIVGTSGSVPAGTATIGWVETRSTSQYHTDGLASGSHTVSIVGLTDAADFHVYPDGTYSLESACTFLHPGTRECTITGTSAYFAVSAGPLNRVGAGYIMLVW